MAPSSGTMLIPQAFKIMRHAIQKTTFAIRASAPSQPAIAPLRRAAATTKSHPTLRPSHVQKAHAFATSLRNTIVRIHLELNPTTPSRVPLRSSLPTSCISRHIASRPGFAPFASTLRPNLTGGALPRSAGGYAISGNGVRAFSHIPAQQAQVLQNVSLGVRAFWGQGYRARFDGWDCNRAKRFTCVSRNHDDIARQVERNSAFVGGQIRGSSLEFQLGPIITALKVAEDGGKKIIGKAEVSLQTPNLFDTLTSDFSAAIANLSAVLADLNTLSTCLGDLPISYTTSASGKQILSVRFAGCDGLAVESLCAELGIRRGVVREDEAWDVDQDVQMALLFPFADGQGEASDAEDLFEKRIDERNGREEVFWADMLSPGESHRRESPLSPLSRTEMEGSPLRKLSRTSADGSYVFEPVIEEREVWAEEWRGNESESEQGFEPGQVGLRTPSEEMGYDGLEGVCRFLAECEAGRRM